MVAGGLLGECMHGRLDLMGVSMVRVRRGKLCSCAWSCHLEGVMRSGSSMHSMLTMQADCLFLGSQPLHVLHNCSSPSGLLLMGPTNPQTLQLHGSCQHLLQLQL